MHHRLVALRTYDPSLPAPHQDRNEVYALSMWRVALCASEETLQTGFLARSTLRLFQDQLSMRIPDTLVWRGDLGASAEIRRALSALYGWYFARAFLTGRLGVDNLVPLNRFTTRVARSGVTVRRISDGDIPDWIGWDGRRGGFVLGEAKGNISGSVASFWAPSTPSCVVSGKAQFGRVEVLDASGSVISTKNWVAANLWATEVRDRVPTTVLWDPPREGRTIGKDESGPLHAAMVQRWVMSIALGLGRPDLFAIRRGFYSAAPTGSVRITAPGGGSQPLARASWSIDDEAVGEKIDQDGHSGEYLAVLIDGRGVRPLVGQDRAKVAMEAGRRGSSMGPAMVLGLDVRILQGKLSSPKPWHSTAGIASTYGLSLFDASKIKVDADGP